MELTESEKDALIAFLEQENAQLRATNVRLNVKAGVIRLGEPEEPKDNESEITGEGEGDIPAEYTPSNGMPV